MTEKKVRELSRHQKQLIAAKYAYVAGLIEYEDATENDLCEQRRELKAEFESLVNDIRATALREAQAIFEKSAKEGVQAWDPAMVSCVLGARAAKFEQEAIKK